MKQAIHHLSVKARTRGLAEFTDEARRFVAAQHIDTGLLDALLPSHVGIAADSGKRGPVGAARSGALLREPRARRRATLMSTTPKVRTTCPRICAPR